MANLFDRLAGKLSTFLDSRLIFILDCLLSIIASIFALLCLGYMRGTLYASGNFALFWLSSSLIATIVAMLIFKGHKLIIRHTSLHDLLVFVEEVALKFAIMFVVMLIAYRQLYKGIMFALFADSVFTLFLLVFVRLGMIAVYNYFMKKRQISRSCQRVLLFGTGDKSMAAVVRLQNSTHYKVVGFLTEETQPSDLLLANLPVFSYNDDVQFKQKINDYDVDAVLFTSEVDAKQERDGLVKKSQFERQASYHPEY